MTETTITSGRSSLRCTRAFVDLTHLGTLPTAFFALGHVGPGQLWVESHIEIVGATIRAPLWAAAFVAYDGAPEGREDGGLEADE